MITRKILLVDDDPDFIQAVSAMFQSQGYITATAHSAEEGYSGALEFRPDLIILDVNMETEGAGFDLNRRIRKNADFAGVPIIMLTGIDTLSATNQVVDMYRQMMKEGDFEGQHVLKVRHADGSISVDYKSGSGAVYWLPLDSFVSKPADFEVLLSEVGRLLKS